VPRANRYFVPGKIYHLTHRCHDRQFLFKFARDRDRYRQLLWRSLRTFPVSLFAYCLTSNHTHLLVRSECMTAVSEWMQQLEGEFAQAYNRRKDRSGAFWADCYHCTLIEEGLHLWNCIVYIELNMVRAGVVAHPSQWPWCSYAEWMGLRKRYGAVDQEACLSLLGGASLAEFRANYQHLITTTIAEDAMARQPQWTESIAVGSRPFVEAIAQTVSHRQHLECLPVGQSAWLLRDESPQPVAVS
jgi:putative transposase